MGFTHIPQKSAPLINQFMTEVVNPYLNYHRPCFFPQVTINNKGKQIKKYPYKNIMTPYEKLKSLPDAEQYLKDNFSFAKLDDIVYQMSNNDAAKLMNIQRTKLFNIIFGWK